MICSKEAGLEIVRILFTMLRVVPLSTSTVYTMATSVIDGNPISVVFPGIFLYIPQLGFVNKEDCLKSIGT